MPGQQILNSTVINGTLTVNSMNVIKLVLKSAFIIAFSLCELNVYSQNNDEDKFSSVIFGMDFVSNYSLNGRVSMFGNQPRLNTTASYYHKWGFDVSAIYSNVWKSDETETKSTQELAISLGYNYDFTEWLNGGVTYDRFIYSKNSYSIRSLYKNLYAIGLFSEVDWWISDVMAGKYTGRSEESFVVMETGITLDFDNVLKKDNMLSIQPMISAYMGDINYYNISAYTDYYFLYNYANTFPDMTVREFKYRMQNPQTYRDRNLSSRIQDKPLRIKKINELPTSVVLWDLFEEHETFDFNNIGFMIPVYYYWGDFVINFTYSAYKPINQPSYVDADWNSYSNIGVSYFLSW